MGDPTRRGILRLLSAGELSAGKISENFPISGPSMSHHLNALKNAGLVVSRREGQQIIYTLNTTVVQDLMTWLLDTLTPKEPSK
jgi:DNA-binding transcriptional ArsR family regulator